MMIKLAFLAGAVCGAWLMWWAPAVIEALR